MFIELILLALIVLYLLKTDSRESFQLAIPDKCGCDSISFTQDMYHSQVNPFDWGFLYSTDPDPVIYYGKPVPKIVKN